MFGPIHHVGFVMRDLAGADQQFRSLGYLPHGSPVVDERQALEIVFLERQDAREGEPLVELIRPINEQSTVYGFTTRNDYSIHHVCFMTADIDRAVRLGRQQRFYVVQEPVPAPAFGGSRIAFLYARGTGLYELLENPPF